MKYWVLAIVILLVPGQISALCSQKGYTILYVNGVLTTKEQAQEDAGKLQKNLGIQFGSEPAEVRLAYNPSHLAGAGDLLKSVEQTYLNTTNTFIQDYDLNTILTQIYPEVRTQKILLVGHSQGTFYSNSLYQYLVDYKRGGMPAGSVGVYNLATPASFVAGGGEYLTSSNDSLISYIREVDAKWGATLPLPANISIPISRGGMDDKWMGHHFYSDYLRGAPDRIVGDIRSSLGILKAGNITNENEEVGCFTPPSLGLGHKVVSIGFAIADPAVSGVVAAGKATGKGTANAAVALASGYDVVQNTFNNAVASAWYSIFPRPNAENAAVALSTVKALYGSSLSSDELADLLAEEDANGSPFSDPKPKNQLEQKREGPDQQYAKDGPLQKILGTSSSTPSSTSDSTGLTPGYGGGGGQGSGGPSNTGTTQGQQQNQTNNSSGQQQSSQTQPSLPFAILLPEENALVGTTSVTFLGTTTPGLVVMASSTSFVASSTSDILGNWSIQLDFPEGQNQILFSVSDTSGVVATTSRSITIDLSMPNQPNVSIRECAHSLSTGMCLIPVSSVSLYWDMESHIAFYSVFKNGTLLGTTTADFFGAIADSNATSTFEVVAHKVTDTIATSSPVTMRVISNPIVVNEIAWFGTLASPQDEWIEIKNMTDYEIDLSSVALRNADNSISIPLSGTIDPRHLHGSDLGLYLIAYASSSLQQPADMVSAAIQLADSGGQLFLEWTGDATTTLDMTPSASTCGSWCAGNSLRAYSMERNDGAPDGALATSWHTNDRYLKNGMDAMGNKILGTPRAANSSGWPDYGFFCGQDSPVVPDTSYNPVSGPCTFLTEYIGHSGGPHRRTNVYLGTIGSSTYAGGADLGQGNMSIVTTTLIPGGTPAGPAFLELHPTSDFISELSELDVYFRTGTPLSDTNSLKESYRIVPFMYQP